MSVNTLKEIDFSVYFSLLRKLFPAARLFVCNITGGVLAADKENPGSGSADDQIPAVRHMQYERAGSRVMVSAMGGEHVCGVAIRAPVDEIAGFLVLAGAGGIKSAATYIEAVVDCIEREYRMILELNSMAHELTGRYEELNLIYESADEVTRVEEEEITLRQLMENFVNFLEVDMVALITRDSEMDLFASKDDSISQDPEEVVSRLGSKLLHRVYSSRDCLIINDITDKQREEYSLDVPYKLMSAPVFNSRGEVVSTLICLNHLYRRDFYNSDRSLLMVMARKVAKITQTNYDVLTGLMNPHAFNGVFREILSETTSLRRHSTLLNIDIDQLKVHNDSRGREYGDALIRAVAAMLRHKLRASDVIGYQGEGRFIVLLVQCNVDQAIKVVEELHQRLRSLVVIRNEAPIEVQISTGIATVDADDRVPDEMLEAAELARMAAKEQGNGQIRVFRRGDQELQSRKNSLHCVSQIQKALRDNRFVLYCQTIQPVERVAEQFHMEVLVRMLDENGAVVSPDRFIPVAEQFTLMPLLDRWVIENAFSMLSSAGIAIRPGQGVVSINLSGQSLADYRLAAFIENGMSTYGIDPGCVCFEITETAAIGNRETAHKIFHKLKDLGCHFSLDDFGTGLSTFSYLKELPVDYVKIDGSFVRNLLEDHVSAVMVDSIIQIGREMKLKTVAEYVENEAIAKRLAEMGVDYLQGYGVARPQPLIEYLADLGDSTAAFAAG